MAIDIQGKLGGEPEVSLHESTVQEDDQEVLLFLPEKAEITSLRTFGFIVGSEFAGYSIRTNGPNSENYNDVDANLTEITPGSQSFDTTSLNAALDSASYPLVLQIRFFGSRGYATGIPASPSPTPSYSIQGSFVNNPQREYKRHAGPSGTEGVYQYKLKDRIGVASNTYSFNRLIQYDLPAPAQILNNQKAVVFLVDRPVFEYRGVENDNGGQNHAVWFVTRQVSGAPGYEIRLDSFQRGIGINAFGTSYEVGVNPKKYRPITSRGYCSGLFLWDGTLDPATPLEQVLSMYVNGINAIAEDPSDYLGDTLSGYPTSPIVRGIRYQDGNSTPRVLSKLAIIKDWLPTDAEIRYMFNTYNLPASVNPSDILVDLDFSSIVEGDIYNSVPNSGTVGAPINTARSAIGTKLNPNPYTP